jgi:hypothetical protein
MINFVKVPILTKLLSGKGFFASHTRNYPAFSYFPEVSTSQNTKEQAVPATSLQNNAVASDVLAAVLASLNIEKFSGDPEKIHSTLARAKRHYPILDVFSFSSGDIYPFSRELEDALSILQRSRMIRMQNPDFDTYLVTPSGKRVGERYLSKFSDGERAQIEELAEIFEFECGVRDPDDRRSNNGAAHS